MSYAARPRIFTNEMSQDVAILATVTVSLATLAYFYYEIKKNRVEHEKNKLELAKLQKEVADKGIPTENTSSFEGGGRNSYTPPDYKPQKVRKRFFSPMMA